MFNGILNSEAEPNGEIDSADRQNTVGSQAPKVTSKTKLSTANKESDSRQGSSLHSGSGSEIETTSAGCTQTPSEQALPPVSVLTDATDRAAGAESRASGAAATAPSQSSALSAAAQSPAAVAFMLNLTWQRSPLPQYSSVSSPSSAELDSSSGAKETPQAAPIPSGQTAVHNLLSSVVAQCNPTPNSFNTSKALTTADLDHKDIAGANPSTDRLSMLPTAEGLSRSPRKDIHTPASTLPQQDDIGAPNVNATDYASEQEATAKEQPTDSRTTVQNGVQSQPAARQSDVRPESEEVSPPKPVEIDSQRNGSTSGAMPDKGSAFGAAGRDSSKTAPAVSTSPHDQSGSDTADSQPKAPIKDKLQHNQSEPVHPIDASGSGTMPGSSPTPHFERQAVTKPATEDSPSNSATVHPAENLTSAATRPLHAIALQLGTPGSDKVDVQVATRGGKIQVAVRTPDQDLTKSLQGNLGDLVSRLEDKGFKTEAWTPGTASPSPTVKDAASAANTQNQSDSSGSHPGSHGRQDAQQQSGQRQPDRWKDELEETLTAPNALTYEEEAL